MRVHEECSRGINFRAYANSRRARVFMRRILGLKWRARRRADRGNNRLPRDENSDGNRKVSHRERERKREEVALCRIEAGH